MLIPAWLTIVIIIIIVAFIILVINRSILAHRRHVSAGREDFVGRIAIVETALNPKGTVLIEGERWTAISDSGNVESDEEVVINKVSGLKLHVVKK